ncbi:lysophospholipid acyltransferase family protein [Geoalkalibacter halelectricus]|uniref:Lysophospholipid acyltransferase family protein n=1 Tax=Geoalkalibacter halelectricus TaxID=2847045 RepID=A0ABY5ZI36_9BACT|nr:lysophospholipid acyltransferase family protein [Geoalkalibacter halelectricus]MDO3378996.1 lysophospholipid acyltransferase family protein [Geoalkalibacter halelectricus]UWZ78810.1 lysophospholipid acyltransferase family protein [Geoalkalibacter halelectricus]
MSTTHSHTDPFRISGPFRAPVKQKAFSLLAGACLERLLRLNHCREIYSHIQADPGPEPFPERVLRHLGIDVALDEQQTRNVPRSGPALVVANHPFGAVEGLVLAALLQRLRPDVKFMANYLLQRIPQMADLIIAVDPFGREASARDNIRPLRQCLNWLKGGGLLVVFPAGEVSHLHLHRRQVTDPPWNPNLGRLVRKSGAMVVPVYFSGSNGAAFQLAGLVHPGLRTALLPRELLNKQRRRIFLRIGSPLAPESLAALPSDQELIGYLRARTYALAAGQGSVANRFVLPGKKRPQPLLPAPIEPVVIGLLGQEIADLPAAQLLLESGPYQCWQTSLQQSPNLLREIGRLREITFRASGEGTGQPIDLDAFDHHYTHILLWHRDLEQIVGAYRVGRCDEILKNQGPEGLYLRTLFRFDRELLEKTGPALELGRSFVRCEYQKSYSPLLLLWKGIGRFVARHPHYRTLLGPVSISRTYSDLSRRLIAGCLSQQLAHPELTQRVRPQRPLNLHRAPRIKGCSPAEVNALMGNLDGLDQLIADIEPDRKGLPVLLRHYLNLGGKLLGFNLDPDFSDVIDGLLLVDLLHTEERLLERYLGKEAAAAYLHHHCPPESLAC